MTPAKAKSATRPVPAGTCAAVGVMNAIEIDIGNLKRWLWGQIGASGTSVDFATQNGWVLYFSDRRGMLPNPNAPYNGVRSREIQVWKTLSTAAPLRASPMVSWIPSPRARQSSPEDDNQNKVLDNFGATNIGLGFYNAAANVNRGAGGIAASAPSNPYLPRLSTGATACSVTGRKNWVSGARHVLKLVDGGFGNVPYRQDGTLASPGGFTVASENPVYIQGDYNSNAADPTWGGGGDIAGHACGRRDRRHRHASLQRLVGSEQLG